MKTAIVWAGCAVWFVGVTAIMLAVWSYKTTDNGSAAAPARWPSASTIRLATDRPNIIMFAHPQCPCTRASMTELSRLAAEIDGRAAIHVVLVRPPGTEPGFEEGTLRDRARALPGARVVVDIDGVESARFHAKTSGSVVLYSARGELLFTGGITTARGHEGRAPSSDRILAVVAGQATGGSVAPTFGCALQHREVSAVP